ncbi:MAG: DUF6485 family protein [Phycisphaerae bacterium]|nr:DUF6485 family protein [Phycisphaerae bacterium]
MECRRETNSAKCPCQAKSCENRGLCCDCLASHLGRKSLPRCFFPADPVKPPDRSFQGFAKAWNL